MANSQLIEILLLAMVAGVILFRLYTVLGRRTGHEPPPKPYRVSGPAEQAADKPATAALPAPRGADLPADPIARGLMEIKLADRAFDQEHFLAGARHAYELILTAFSANDRVTLKPLLSDEVYAAFDAAMHGREDRNEKVTFTFVGFKDSKIIEASLRGKTADIAVAITAQFISATTDANDAVIEGDPKSVREVTDIWAFERNVRAGDPNWTLVHTSGAEPSA
jgi:predicted lipid-binding transport protein (Tim44 family)